MVDVWEASVKRQTYTLYTPTGAAWLDRIYVTEDLRRQKQGVETIAADHLAVLLRVDMTTLFIHTGRVIWRMNTSNLNDLPFQDKIKEAWTEWKTRVSRYSSLVGTDM